MRGNSAAESPIGIFDSGIGGLTVTSAIIKKLPNEPIIYFGDTAHMPYGDKSTVAIQTYAVKIAQLLVQRQCKLILIACNSASAAAYEVVKEDVGSRALVMNVIDPLVHHLHTHHPGKHIGLIGTRQTVHSRIYQQKLQALQAPIKLTVYATNLLAAAIEEFGDHPLIDNLLTQYLTHPTLQNLDSLVLACTHYPVIKHRIAAFYQHTVPIIDAAEIVANEVQTTLQKQDLIAQNSHQQKHFYVSDYTESFAQHAALFFAEKINLEHYPIWE